MFHFLKGKVSNAVDWLVDRSTAVYSICITSLIFMGLMFVNNVTHEAEMIKALDDNINLNANVELYEELAKSQSGYITTANEIMMKQKRNLIEADKFIQMQSDVIKKLMERLKYLDDWPPKTPIDPDKWTEEIKDKV